MLGSVMGLSGVLYHGNTFYLTDRFDAKEVLSLLQEKKISMFSHAPLVFAKLYFPHSDPLVGTLEAFSIYAVGFVSRPVGAALFGHYGDRIGRKVTLISTLLLTGLSTFAVGFVPGYDTIGIWGAVILTVVRFIQGMGIGGEWGGATLIAMEWAKTNSHRGFITSWPQWGGPAGLFSANVAVC